MSDKEISQAEVDKIMEESNAIASEEEAEDVLIREGISHYCWIARFMSIAFKNKEVPFYAVLLLAYGYASGRNREKIKAMWPALVEEAGKIQMEEANEQGK